MSDIDMGRPAPRPWPEIPCSWVGHIPEVYICFWLAPADKIGPEFLRVVEEERYKLRPHFDRLGWSPKAPGEGEVVGPGTWGPLETLDYWTLILSDDAHLTGLLTGANPALKSESYQQMLQDFEEKRGGVDWVMKQRAIEVETRPLVREAIELARAARAGVPKAVEVVTQLAQQVLSGAASDEERGRLALFYNAMYGPEGPESVEAT